MINQHLKTSWRSLIKNKAFSLINIIGLALGMFCVIIIFLWINYETGFDKFHKNYDQLNRVVNNWGDDKDKCCPGALAKYMIDNYPEVENAATYTVAPNIKLTYKNERHWVTGGMADSSFFKMFTFPLVSGNMQNIFPEPNSAVITQDIAQKFFGNDDPLGKMMEMEFEGMVVSFQVSGVIESIPKNSSFQFDFLVSAVIAPTGYYAWTNNWPEVFVQLKESTSYKNLSEKIDGIAKKYNADAINSFELKPFSQEHLYSINGGGLIDYVKIFSLVAIVVLLIACFNYINLSTAQMIDRQKEIGIKKVLGASKAIIQKQFMFEVTLIALISLNLAYIGVKVFLPFLNALLNKNIMSEFSPMIYLSLLGIVFMTSLISGIYPSIYLASLKAIFIINKTGKKPGKKISFRNILVICQFTFTIILIISLMGIYTQLNYMREKELGFNKEGIVLVSLQGNAQNQIQVIKDGLLKNPNILNVCGSSFHPVMQDGETSFVKWKNMPENKRVSAKFNYVDYDYVNTLDIKMKEGRFFSEEFADKSTEVFVVNEELAKSIGLENPVGSQITLFGENYGTIIGVMKNFHNETLHQNIREYAVMLDENFSYLSVNIKLKNISETIQIIKKELKKIEPSLLFSYHFLDDEIERKYYQDMLIGKLTLFFAILSIFISLLGLFGLVLFTINQHIKEIGIRKVNGAQISDILLRLNFHFIKWVAISFIFAIPMSVFVINKWLSNFAFRTDVSWWIFIWAGLGVLIFTSLIVSVQSWKTACKNPVDSLRHE